VQICLHSCRVIVLDVFFLLLLFLFVCSCHVSTVLCDITVLWIIDTCQCKNSCRGAPAL